MLAYFAVKFHEDMHNRSLIEAVTHALGKKHIGVSCMARDFENWGLRKFSPKELMRLTFQEIDKADLLVIDISEEGVGLGIEAGYAHSKGKPITVIAKAGSDIPRTLEGIAKQIIFYTTPEEIEIK